MDKNTLEIVIAAGGMPFGPDTLKHRSLGGSETAVLGVAGQLKALGHIVTVFCPLPQTGPDAFQSGSIGEDGVRYVQIEQFHNFIATTEVDLLVVSRSPELFQIPHQARKAVLWCHDLATYNGPSQAVQAVGWNFDEVWCVSEWHKAQYHKVTGYPLDHIRATRNGIIPYIVEPMGRADAQLVYAARPERGLEQLVRPGGIMSLLPEFSLKVTMYDNFPPHMEAYYTQLFQWAGQLPNVEILPPHTQGQLRQLIADSTAYIYPTNFEETSCMLARECIEQGTPMITTRKGALPETLGACGLFIGGIHAYGTDDWCQMFAKSVRLYFQNEGHIETVIDNMATRKDLYWDQVATDWVSWAQPTDVTPFSHAWSLLEDSDVIAALAYINSLPTTPASVARIKEQIEALYPYLFGRESLAHYYERYFVREDSKGARKRNSMVGDQRFETIASEVAGLAPGSKVLDYGCAEGVIILDLAARFRDKVFHGVDHAETNVNLCKKYAKDMGLKNVTFSVAETPDEAPFECYDAVICSEVLEHVPEPWTLISDLEQHTHEGARIIITVPQGPWEAIGLYNIEQFQWRAHIWHINKWMLRNMFSNKEECRMISLFNGHQQDGRMLGHLVFSYTADMKHALPINPLDKAMRARKRNTVGAAIIARNSEESIMRTLNSLGNQVQQVSIALSIDTTDMTLPLIKKWESLHPWIQVSVTGVQKIEAGVFGFDDARNASVEPLDTDWYLWIDTDEYISGDFTKYARNNAFDSYAVHQHHFTCDPRGAPTMLDKPARFIRTDRGFQFYGKVHEHSEKGFNGGPGFTFILGDVDIGHTGYVNEGIRRQRFDRNFPLLEWDRQLNPDRNLGKYLWLRDIVHRMRYMVEQQNVNAARLLSEEAVSFYRTEWKDWDTAGMGGMNAFSYYSEALAFQGRGLVTTVQIKLGDGEYALQGIAESAAELGKLVEVSAKAMFEQKDSGYWQ